MTYGSFCRGGSFLCITPERKFATTGYRTHDHQVMSQTGSPEPPGRLKPILALSTTVYTKIIFQNIEQMPDKSFFKKVRAFTCLQFQSVENFVRKGEIAHKKQFLHFPQCFLSLWRTLCHFHKI